MIEGQKLIRAWIIRMLYQTRRPLRLRLQEKARESFLMKEQRQERRSMQMANMERVFTERMGKMEIDVSQLRDAISLTGEGNYPSKKEAEEAPLNSKAKQAPPKSKGAQAPPKSKGAQAPPKRNGDQPTPTKKVLPKRKCRT
ncbi:hypothetical protein HID58_087933 [Brassica napus]|uniref:Uncharacterized protein n=1 Tax=Brassica napus TaxID=3708 RepID=A0ABQ7XUR6_BRANA|nr:hypothetical protein HID58_087933 [Brassica napus]